MGNLSIIGKLVNRLRMINHIHVEINLGHKITLAKPEELWERNKIRLS